MRVTSKSGRVFDLPAADEETKIRTGIEGDADTWALTDAQLECLHPMPSPAEEGNKQSVLVSLSPEVIEFFRSGGNDWQIRIDEVLKAYVASCQ